MTYKLGDIVVVNFPFSGAVGSKRRPAVVISHEEFNIEVSDIHCGEAIYS